MADKSDKSNDLEPLKQEIVHRIQSGIVSKEVKDFERLLGKETAELLLEKYAEKHGGLTTENLTSLLSHLNSKGNSSANKPTEHDYIEEMEEELPKSASMSVPDLHEQLMKLESEIRVTQQQRDCLLRYLLRERFINPKEVKIKEALGRGKYGEVYRAKLGDHLYAVKSFQPTDMDSLFHELEVAAHCQHPNLLRVLGGTFMKQSPLLVCELHPGSLSVFIRKYREAKGGLPEKLILSLARDIAKGLSHIHGKKLVHRDLKSDNVLVREKADDSWEAIVSDFGTVGRPKYGTPDEFQTYQIDIFSLGLVVQEMEIGEKPDQKRLEEQLNKVKCQSLEKLIRCCTATDCSKRYSAEDVKVYCDDRLREIDLGLTCSL